MENQNNYNEISCYIQDRPFDTYIDDSLKLSQSAAAEINSASNLDDLQEKLDEWEQAFIEENDYTSDYTRLSNEIIEEFGCSEEMAEEFVASNCRIIVDMEKVLINSSDLLSTELVKILPEEIRTKIEEKQAQQQYLDNQDNTPTTEEALKIIDEHNKEETQKQSKKSDLKL